MKKEKLKCVEYAQKGVSKLNREGKENLAMEILAECSEEELDKFLKVWGYDRK
jgi:hypothetical protein